MATHIHRVIVRGFFDGLDDEQRAWLREAQPDHDILRSSFAGGTLTYEPDVSAFSFRYEVRTTDDDGPDPTGAALAIGLARAEAALDEMGVGARRLRATARDMADVWTEG